MTAQQPPETPVADEVIATVKSLRGASGPGPSSGIGGISLREDSLRFGKGRMTGELAVRYAYTGLHENDWEEERVYTVTPQDLAKIAAADARFAAAVTEMRSAAQKLFTKGTPNATPAPKTARFGKNI